MTIPVLVRITGPRHDLCIATAHDAADVIIAVADGLRALSESDQLAAEQVSAHIPQSLHSSGIGFTIHTTHPAATIGHVLVIKCREGAVDIWRGPYIAIITSLALGAFLEAVRLGPAELLAPPLMVVATS